MMNGPEHNPSHRRLTFTPQLTFNTLPIPSPAPVFRARFRLEFSHGTTHETGRDLPGFCAVMSHRYLAFQQVYTTQGGIDGEVADWLE